MPRRVISAQSVTRTPSFCTRREAYRRLGEAVLTLALNDVAGKRHARLGVPVEKVRRDAEAFFLSDRVWLFCSLAGLDVESVRKRAWALCMVRDRAEGRQAKGLRAVLMAVDARKRGGLLVRSRMLGIGEARR